MRWRWYPTEPDNYHNYFTGVINKTGNCISQNFPGPPECYLDSQRFCPLHYPDHSVFCGNAGIKSTATESSAHGALEQLACHSGPAATTRMKMVDTTGLSSSIRSEVGTQGVSNPHRPARCWGCPEMGNMKGYKRKQEGSPSQAATAEREQCLTAGPRSQQPPEVHACAE